MNELSSLLSLTIYARDGKNVTSQLKAKLGSGKAALQPYRKRLLEAGVIEAPRRGELVFAVPCLADYLRSQNI